MGAAPCDPRSSGVGSPQRRHLAWIILGFGVAYSLTATWGLDANVDVIAAALPGWSVVERGTITLDHLAGVNPWIVESAIGFVSNRPPGLSALALPAYLVTSPDGFTNAPATATAVIVAVGALVALYVVLCRVVDERIALLGVVVMGLGTSTWSVSADSLWPHGPGQLFAALGLLALASARHVVAGTAMGAALLIRPVTAAATAVLGLLESVRSRSWRPVIGLGIPSVAALAVMLAYNRIVFGRVSLSGGYQGEFADRLATSSATEWLANFAGMLVSAENGLLLWSPFVVVGVAGMVLSWRVLPGWVRSAAVAALVYLVLHARLNRASGGVPFGYRYPLESLMLAAPALTLGVVRVFSSGRIGAMLVRFSVGLSVALQLALVFLLECEDVPNTEVTCSFF